MPDEFPEKFLEKLRSVTRKRAKTVIDHILKHGQITTEELKEIYGYNHPPRAARDVREEGIPLETIRVTGSDGRRIGAYVFGDPHDIEGHKIGGRNVFSKKFKKTLAQGAGQRCEICLEQYEDRYLQVDHRVPYEVSGDKVDERRTEQFMLLCGSCNRAKSWSCEHCLNWTNEKSREMCESCYWAQPESYSHIAMRNIRRLEVIWSEQEINDFDRLAASAQHEGEPLPDFVKDVLKRHIENAK